MTVVGYPEGGRLTVTSGTVIGGTTDPLNENLGEVLVTDAAVEPGSSGSAVLDAGGRVVGVVYAKNTLDQSFIVPVSTLRGPARRQRRVRRRAVVHRLTTLGRAAAGQPVPSRWEVTMSSTDSTESTDSTFSADRFDSTDGTGGDDATVSRTSHRGVDHGAITRAVRDLLTVRRVFGEAYERGGVLVIPVAKVLGGTGSGYGSGEGGDGADGKDAGYGSGEGGGGGFGVRVRPVGAYVVDDSGVHWRPALDLNRVILGGQLAAMVAVVAVSRAVRRRRRHH